jgi:hydroxyethylthiazole kinase
MILSPPFLPEPLAETDEQFIERAMPGGAAGDGGFPLSFDLNWHGGLHLTAPTAPAGAGQPTALPVRAIADGTVAFVRAPQPVSADPKHALNYRGGWTDDGCVVIRHETEIGAATAAPGNPTNVVLFSVYMHLRSIVPEVAQGQRIFRKSILGTAGRIYGAEHRIHFEIICDDANVSRLLGRNSPFTSIDHDGRSDAIFGAIWYLLLVDTPFYATEPAAGKPLPAVVHQNTAAYFVRIDFRDGAAVVQTFHVDGRPVAAERIDANFEYNLFKTAKAQFPLSPSAGYELLRFGRVLGPDALNPADAAHWRQVSFVGGTGWVNLNAANVRKFSDADYPHWVNGSVLVDGSTNTDSRCHEPAVLELLDANGDWKFPPEEVTQSLNDPERQRRLAQKVCKHATEWDASDFDARYGWLKTDKRILMKASEFERLRLHVTALAFWPAAALGIDRVHWHFHPRVFIRHFRKCGWFSLDELAQLLPRRPMPGSNISFATARTRFQAHYGHLNRVFRKYNVLDAKRQSHFLAQTFIEVALWRTDIHMREIGRARPNSNGSWPAPAMEFYAAFYGRGIMQLTWAGNYEGYGNYRRFPVVAPTATYGDNRITHTSTHFFQDPRNSAGVVTGTAQRWAPRYDPEVVADDAFAACDSGAFYWVSKNIGQSQTNIHRVADRVFDSASVGRISVLVNGGGYGYADRQRWAAYIFRYRSDSTAVTPTATFVATHGNTQHNIVVDFTPQRP